jgi:radical SAM-linked protein
MEFKAKLVKEFLPFVIKPGQYIGNEFGAIRRNSGANVRLLLAIPRTYDTSATDFEVQSLYNRLNSESEVSCERVFLPGKDAQGLLRKKEIPLFSLENFGPVSQFDGWIILCRSPLDFPAILQMLNLGEIQIQSASRQNRPWILGTGRGFVNPAPMGEFLDGFVLEWGDKTASKMAAVLEGQTTKKETLSRLAEIDGVYIPGHTYKKVPPQSTELANLPSKPVVPFIEMEQDKLFAGDNSSQFPTVEMKRSEVVTLESMIQSLTAAMQNSGFETVRLDFAQLRVEPQSFLLALEKKLKDRRFVFEIDNFPLQTFDSEMAELLAGTNRHRVSFGALAPSQRLRDWLGQDISEEMILATLQLAIEKGFQTVTAKFVLGFPTETPEDLQELGRILTNLNESFTRRHRCKHLQIEFVFFAPLPNTLWQWDGVLSLEQMKEKISLVREKSRAKHLKLVWPDLGKQHWENLLWRGDDKLSQAILKVSQKMSEWLEDEDYWPDWGKIFSESGLSEADYSRAFKFEEELPWDSVITPEEKESLRNARTSRPALLLQSGNSQTAVKKESSSTQTEQMYGRRAKIISSATTLSPSQSKIRMKWMKAEKVRFTSHLDVVRMFEKTIRRVDFPVGFSEGFHPHPKIAYGPPLPLGFISECEYVDMQLEAPFNYQIIEKLNSALPEGFRITEARPVFAQAVSLSAFINTSVYEIELENLSEKEAERLQQLPREKEILVNRKSKEGTKQVNIAGLIYDVKVASGEAKQIVRISVGLSQQGYARPQEVLQAVLRLSQEDLAGLIFKRTDLLSKKGDQYLSPMKVL